LKLHIRDDDGRLTIVPLVRDSITIGRSEGNTIRLTERNVSRQHARLLQDGDVLYLEEIKSRFGTRINGDPVGGKIPVCPGDVIEIGDYQLALHEDTTELAAKTTSEMPAVGRVDTPIAIPLPPDVGDPNAVTAMINLADLPASADDHEHKTVPKKQRARLVILSPQLAGVEHVLSETPTIIGRTEEHNFQIDHRSISRNHAMITYEDGGYTLHDMGSSNGLKVNGEFYRRVDLHAGDELELGHVKVRFVGPGEQFVVGSASEMDEYPVATEAAASPLTKIVVLVTGVIAIAVVCFWIFGDHFITSPKPKADDETSASVDDESSLAPTDPLANTTSFDEATTEDGEAEDPAIEVEAETDKPAGTDEPVVAAPPKDENDEAKPQDTSLNRPLDDKPIDKVAPAATPKPSEDDTTSTKLEEAAALGKRAQGEYRNGNLTKATTYAEKALALDKHQSLAQTVLNQVKADRAAYSILKKTQQARDKGDWRTVWKQATKGLNRSPSSDIKGQLRTLRDEAKKELVGDAIKRGDSLSNKKKWKSAIRAYKEARKYDRKNTKAAAGIRKANKALADNKPPTPQPANGGGSKLDTAKALYKQATTAKYNGDLGTAEKLYRQCLKAHPGMASCRAALVPLLMSRGKVCDAVKHMRRYVKSYPGAKKTPSFKKLIETFEARCN